MTQILAAHTTNESHGADVTLHQCGEPLARTVLPLTAFIAGTRAEGTLWRGIPKQRGGVGDVFRADAAGQVALHGGLGKV